MPPIQPLPVFDGHNDLLLRLWRGGREGSVERFLQGEGKGHIDLPRARQGGLIGGLCAVYVPSERVLDDQGNWPTPSRAEAIETTIGMAALLSRISHDSQGKVTLCRNGQDLVQAIEQQSFAAVLHLEGAEAIGADLDLLYLLHDAGLRSLGPVWSRPNIFAFGVPFRFPSTPDIGPGLSAYGKDLVRKCNELGIMIDLSHMNDAGFWDIARISHAPLVASHSNAHRLCPHSRNLTDAQLDAIRDTNGLVGINFGVSFLNPTGEKDSDLPLSAIVDHVEYVIERIGIDHVALGSDFDGTTISSEMRDASDLPKLVDLLQDRGYRGAELEKITHRNWLRVLTETWDG